MADPPPGLALDGVIRLPEPFAYLLPPTQPLVDDGAVAASETVAMPSIGRGVTFDATTAAIGVNADLADSQHDEAWRSHQAALATAAAQLDGVEVEQGIVATPPQNLPDAIVADAENALMTEGLEPPDGITLEQAVVDFPPPIHTIERPWNRVPKGARNTYTVTCMSRRTL